MSLPDGTVDDVDPLALLRAPQLSDEADQPPWWRDRLPLQLRPRPVLIAVAAVLAAGVVVAWLLRAPQPAVEQTLPVASADSTPIGTPPGQGTSATPERVVVHVAGAVAEPGVYRLLSDRRVHHAVDAAGGATGAADLARINLAAGLQDGVRIYVPAVGESLLPSVIDGVVEGGAGASVDLNAASNSELETLPGVGAVTAASIIEHRERVGGFAAVDDLLDVPGIGEAKLEAIRPLVSV